jgi:endonuclease/exonuclease/phosphatase (EEP) superfamily protein YafD
MMRVVRARLLSRSRLLAGAGWLLTVPTAVFALGRLTGLTDRWATTFAIAVFTPLVLAPAWGGLLAAVLARRRLLAVVAGWVVLLQLTWAWPQLKWWAGPQPTTDAAPVEIVASNVYLGNRYYDRAAEALLAREPDVLVLTEFSARAQDEFAVRTRASLPHRAEDPQQGAFGSAIYSRYPITAVRHLELDRFRTLDVDLALPGGTVRLVAVHTLQPLSDVGVLRRQFAELERLVRAHDGPLILAGDFNAGVHHGPFRDLLDAGLRDAHLERGLGRVRTWPLGRRLPPITQIDHVLVSKGFAVEGADTVVVPGSDHRAVTAEVAFGK